MLALPESCCVPNSLREAAKVGFKKRASEKRVRDGCHLLYGEKDDVGAFIPSCRLHEVSREQCGVNWFAGTVEGEDGYPSMSIHAMPCNGHIQFKVEISALIVLPF